MARFKFLGNPQSGSIKKEDWGPSTIIRVPKKDGTKFVMTPIPPATSFVIGEDLGYDIADERVLRILRSDTQRFQEIV